MVNKIIINIKYIFLILIFIFPNLAAATLTQSENYKIEGTFPDSSVNAPNSTSGSYELFPGIGQTIFITNPNPTPEVNPGGGGLVIIGIKHPELLSVKINNGATSTLAQIVTLTMGVNPEITAMAISNRPDFLYANKESFTKEKIWKLSNGYGLKTVYAKFYNSQGTVSHTLSATILYQNPSVPNIEPSQKNNDIDKDGDYDIFDFNQLMRNWGVYGMGNPADLNNNGVVDILDFNQLMVRWK